MTVTRLALVITDLDRGGAEQALTTLATRLDRSRFDPKVYCLAPPPTDDRKSCVPALQAAGIPVECLNATGLRHFVPAAYWLARMFRRDGTVLVQSFLFHANLMARIAARIARVPVVIAGLRVAEHDRRGRLRVDRMTSGLVNHYVCVSEAVRRFSAACGGIPSKKLSVIPNAVDAARLPASPVDLAAFGIPSGAQVATFVGRLHRQKGLDWLLKTAPIWLDRLPSAHLLLVGSGPEKRFLQAEAASSGIASRVHFAGWRGDTWGIMAASDLLVLPSRWEGMPNVVLEAMASGLPVLASDVEGVREVLGEAASEQTVRFGDTARFAAAAVRLLSDSSQADKLSAHNRLRAVSHFSIERMVDSYESLWASLLPPATRH